MLEYAALNAAMRNIEKKKKKNENEYGQFLSEGCSTAIEVVLVTRVLLARS